MAADLQFKIGADLAEIKAALAGLKKDFADTGRAAGQIGASRGLDQLANQALTASRAVKALLAGLAGFAAVRAFTQAATDGVAFNAELEAANSAIASLIFAQSKLRDAQGQVVDGAQGLRVAYGLAEDQVQKLRVAGLETAATSRQLVEAFQSAVGPGIAAGLNLDEIRTLTIQITQAAGALNVPFDQLSQEIRSILDGSIDVNSRVAKTLGISNEQVKNWQAQGKLVEELSKRLQPFEEAGRAAADNFKVIASNAQEALDTLRGEVFTGFTEQLKKGLKDATSGLFDTKTLSVTPELRDAVVLAQELATAIGSGVADALRGTVELARDFSAYVRENRAEIDVLVELATFVAGQFAKLVQAAASLVVGIGDAGLKLGLFQGALLGIGFLLAGIRDGFRTIAGIVVGIGSLIVTAVLAPFEGWLRLVALAAEKLGQGGLAASLTSFADGMAEVAASGRQAAADILQPIVDGKGAVAQAVRDLEGVAKAAARAGTTARAAAAAGTGGSVAGLRNPPQLPGADANQVLKAQLESQLKQLEANYQDGLISLARYFAERERLTLAAIDAEIAAERVKQSRLQKNDEAGQRDAATRIALLEQKRLDAQRDVARERYLAEKELQDSLVDLQAQELDNQLRTADAVALRVDLKFRDLLKKLKENGNQRGADLVEGLINTEKARARFAELKAEFERTVQDLQTRVEQIGQQRDLGQITSQQAAAAEAAARADAVARLGVAADKMRELAAATNDPTIVQGANEIAVALQKIGIEGTQGLDRAVIDLRRSLDQMSQSFAQSATNAGVDALTNLFADLSTGPKSASEALRDFVVGFASSMAQIAARALATYAVLQLLDAIYPGLGKAVAAGASVGANTRHTGGMAGQGPRRQVPAWLFAGAPRFHGGGMAGLRADEVPAILQTGERVLSREETAAYNGGGGGTRIVNVIDPNLVQDYMTSSAGERTILNVIERNAGTVRQRLA